MTCNIIHGGLNTSKIKFIKEFQIRKGLSKVNNPITNKGTLHTQVKGLDHVIVRALDFYPKAIPVVYLTWFVGICIKPTSWR